MLLLASKILLVFIAVVCVIHYGALFLFLAKIRRDEWKKPDRKFTPKTMVLLTLRGADPFLNRCVEGLLKQDYPNYDVRLIVDHPDDPALPVVRAIVEQYKAHNVEFLIVDRHYETCTLKCNSLCYAIETLDPSYEVIVILDADTNPHPEWLRHLVEPLSDPRFAAATGHRWYIPDKQNPGSLVRYLWGAAALVQLCLYRIAWGGSLALRRDLIEKGSLLTHWKTAFTDDASIADSIKAVGGQTAIVSSLFMINRETCTLRSFHRWVTRQLLCAKLHHPAWFAVVLQSFLITPPLLLCAGLMIAGLALRDGSLVWYNVASLALYWLSVFGTLPIMEFFIRQKLRQRGEPLRPWTVNQTLRTLAMIPVTQLVYTSAMIRLHFLRRVEWRGVWYEIGRDKTVKLVEYIPYAQVQREAVRQADEPVSL